MEIKIGVQHAPRELVIDTNEDADAVAAIVTGGGPFLTLTDNQGPAHPRADRQDRLRGDRVAVRQHGRLPRLTLLRPPRHHPVDDRSW